MAESTEAAFCIVVARKRIMVGGASCWSAKTTTRGKCICGDFYIGESGGERIKEHKAACKYAHFDKSPVG